MQQDVRGVSQFDGSFNWKHAMKPRELVALWICLDQWVASRQMVCDALLENGKAVSQLRSRWAFINHMVLQCSDYLIVKLVNSN